MAESLRRQLLESAYCVLTREGSSGLTLDAVAAEAGVSKGGVLYHFRSKAALFEAMLQDVVSEMEMDIERFLKDEPPGPGRFLRAYILSSSREICEEEAQTGSAILALIASDPAWGRVYWPAVERWRARATDDGLDPALALALMAAADGLSIWDALGIGEPRRQVRREATEHLLRLTRPAPTGAASSSY